MSKKTRWQKLDTASNIFTATISAQDTKVFRITSALYEKVDPLILKRAVNRAYDQFPLYHYTIRGGIFWHYLEETTLIPVVEEENISPCSRIYVPDQKNLLFRVNYYNKKINLEVFHALSDGTGAIRFMERILYFYIKERYPHSNLKEPKSESIEEYMKDGFNRHFAHLKRDSIFSQKIASATGNIKTSVYHPKGTKTPDLRTHFIEMLMDIREIETIAKGFECSITIFLTSLFIYATYLYAPIKESLTISATVPINLRRFFPTETARNFFATMIVHFTFTGEETLDEVINSIKEQFKAHTTKEEIIKKQLSIINYEQNKIIKIIPRALKDLVLRVINYNSNKKISIAASNIGKMPIDPNYETYIHHISYMTSSVRPQFVSTTFNNILSIGFSTPYRETAIFKNFADFLTDRGVKIKIYSNNIDESEKNEEM